MAKKIDGLVKEAKEKTNEIIQKLGSDGGFSIQPEAEKAEMEMDAI